MSVSEPPHRTFARLGMPPRWACLWAFVVLATAPLTAADWDGRGAERLQDWLAANGPDARPETVDLFGRLYRLLDDYGVDSAAVLLAGELPGLRGELADESLADGYLLAGQLHVFELERYAEAEGLLAEAVARTHYPADADRYFAAAHALAASHFWQFESEEVLRVAQEAHDRATEAGEREWERMFGKWIGRALEIEEEYSSAEEYYRRVLELALAGDDAEARFDAYLNLATNSMRGGDPERGLRYLEPAYGYVGGRADLRAVAQLWEGAMRGQTGELERATEALTAAMATFDRLGQRNRRLHVRMELARVRLQAGDYAAVIPLVEAATVLSLEHEKAFDKLFGFELLAEAHAGLGNYERAYEYLGLLNDVRARLDSINNRREIRELTRQYDVELRERIIAEQEAALADRQWYELALGAVTVVALGLGVLAWVLWRRWRRAKSGPVIAAAPRNTRPPRAR